MADLRRTAQAEDDLIEIWLQIARDNVTAADRQLDRIEIRSRQLLHHPRLGRSREDILPGTKQLTIGNYLLFYRLTAGDIEIIRVLDGRRWIDVGLLDP